MSLPIHLFIHIVFAFVAGYIVWRFWGKPLFSFGAAFGGSVLLDFDHFIDYVIAFGFRFDILTFIHGDQFTKNDKIYVLFHGWEYVILLLVAVWLIKSNLKVKVASVALALGIFLHLVVDVNVNGGMTIKSYSILYRLENRFEMQKIVTPEHYREHLREKQSTRFE